MYINYINHQTIKKIDANHKCTIIQLHPHITNNYLRKHDLYDFISKKLAINPIIIHDEINQ